MENEPSQEDSYFGDCEFDIEGTLLTPDNCVVNLYRPYCWSTVAVELDSGELVDIILDQEVIKTMVKSGFLTRVHDAPSEAYQEWYVNGAIKPLNAEAIAFFDSL